MYSLLIKDRSYPIAVYMAYMMRVKGFTRSQAVEVLTGAAVKMGLRKSATSPANNTVAEWGRGIEAPQWSVVAAMTILEQFGKVPFTDQEWAFWAYAAAERGVSSDSFKGKWIEWLKKAQLYKTHYEQRSVIRKQFQSLSSPQTAMKILLAFKGNGLQSLTLAELFANIDTSPATLDRLEKRITDGEQFTADDMNEVIAESEQAKSIYESLIQSIHELKHERLITHRSNDNILIT
ncbi:hypothetical protein K2895_001054 [Shigella sonnei]|uniref:Uncharacterized protein n=2 Tax=Escherichia coli TaxID=562 RepID=A0A1V2GCX4_ECOLX|nr:hypothetical protein [Escherichia coli]EAB8175176.1 hypothetical protein [Salmonella enterica subsp. enterica serovar Enteritidis]EDW6767787.1 hypothetical protein [Salmonella enterica subsp. enterica serovar Johannesburg]EFV9881527.1 hypothetical protein [Shigella sonnei]EKJ2619653.1 hypothetical protein [Shigella flexneri]HBN2914250.1 hypothetical protein [Escherichia coli O25b:H4-ST131]